MNNKILKRFFLTEDQVTRNGKTPGELVEIVKKKKYDSINHTYLAEVENIVATTYFSGFDREKLAVKLPSDCMSDRDFEALKARLDDDEIIRVKFDNLIIGLVQAKELMFRVTANGMEEIVDLD